MFSWLVKIAQNAVLSEGIHSSNNRPIYILKGNTYPIRQSLGRKGLGFNWYNAKKIWWMYKDRFTSRTAEGLKRLGVDTSILGEEPKPVSPEEPPSPPVETPLETETPISESSVDSSWEEADRKSRWYGFPIKKNIFSDTIQVFVDDQPYSLNITVDRNFKKGRRKIPSYSIHIKRERDNQHIGTLRISSPNQALWGTYNEYEDVIKTIPERLQKRLNLKEQSNLYKQIKYEEEVSKRTPEFLQFLKDHERYGEKKERIVKYLDIETPPYEGSYLVAFAALREGNLWHGDTAIEHPLAPHSRTVYSLYLPPEVHTVDEFQVWLEREFQDSENKAKAKEEYLKYLKSFSYLEEQQQESRSEFNRIVPIIENRIMSTDFFRDRLLELGYIRPAKRRIKRPGIGVEVSEEVPMILDTKKILDASYNFGRLSRTPNFFYAVLAYLMHRHKAGNIGFMSWQIGSNISSFHKTLEQHGLDISYRELDEYLDILAKKLLYEIIGVRARGSAWDQYEAFYGGDWGATSWEREQQNTPTSHEQASFLNSFLNFAEQQGVNRELAQSNPRKAYRQLIMKLHPDINPNAENLFKQLVSLWENVPNEYKKAFSRIHLKTASWLKKII